MRVSILATGPSMSVEVAQSVMGTGIVIAVSDAWRLAPWADILVSSDAAWWKANPDALRFPRRKICIAKDWHAVEGVERFEGVTSGSNSGLLALRVAVSLGATQVRLYGYDMRGTHFFGRHPEPALKNTTPERFEVFKRQFAAFKPKGVEIINCTPGSALRCYPMLEPATC